MATKRQRARTGRPKAELTVSPDEREQVERCVGGRTVSRTVAQRARIVLARAEGESNQVAAAEVTK